MKLAIPNFHTRLMFLETVILLGLFIFIVSHLTPLGIVFADPGDLDPTFGTGGVVALNFPGDSWLGCDDLAVQPDGKIVAAGKYLHSDPQLPLWGLVRLKTDGSLDTTFGNGGIVSDTFPTSLQSRAHGIGIQPDGKIVVVGWVKNEDKTEKRCRTARYLADGDLDSGFGTGGIVTNSVISTNHECFKRVFFQSSGKIVLSGHDAPGTDATTRYDALGNPDLTFGDGGWLSRDIDDIQTDDKLVAGRKWGAARHTADGDLDDTFGTGGMVTTTIGADLGDGYAFVQPDEKIMVKFWYGYFSPPPEDGTIWARYESNGEVDTGFGAGGVFSDTLIDGRESPAALDGQGRYIVAVDGRPDDDYEWRLIRYSPNVTIDLTFGTGGIMSPTHPYHYSTLMGPTIQRDNKILIGEGDTIARFDGGGLGNEIYFPLIWKKHGEPRVRNRGKSWAICGSLGGGPGTTDWIKLSK